MSIASISGGVAAPSFQTANTAASSDKHARGTRATNDQLQPPQMTLQQLTGNPNASDKTSAAATKKSQITENNGNAKQPERTMRHVVQTYNLQGKVRIKFLDSHNNVIYQIPSEMVAKTQDLMTKTQAAANIKG